MDNLLKRSFELGGHLSKNEKRIIRIGGLITILSIWTAISLNNWVSPYILPPYWKIIMAIPEMHHHDALVSSALFSLMLNFAGCLEAIAISLPLGFVIGLLPGFRAFSKPYLDTSRFLPLPAMLGLFIAWFGIYTNMKVQFLAVSIIVYLLPVVAQRVYETKQVYVDTVKTLGASNWQKIRWVYIPDVLSRVWTDIGVLSAISWTYITIAERVNDSEGGLGALAGIAARQSRTDKVYAVLLTIIFIAFLIDVAWKFLDKTIFPFKETD